MISVFYRPEQTAKTKCYSPSPGKPALVVKEWLKKFRNKIKIESFEPVTELQMSAVHDPIYVHELLRGIAFNGFGNKDMSVAKALPYTSGSLLAASKHALHFGIASSPTSGFHHACWGFGGGYCSINGLLVTAVDLINNGLVKKVGILDCDFHYGNGTADIITKLNLESKVKHFTAGKDYFSPKNVSAFFKTLPNVLESMSECGLIIAQLGADPHIDDPLGGFLTDEQLFDRDMIIFETCKYIGAPLCFNLAGGYQEPISKVLKIHNNSMSACIKVFG